MKEHCACGRVLHYAGPVIQAFVERLIAALGPTQILSAPDGRTWVVPRHYVALHGPKAGDVSRLAQKYGWPRTR
jgi:hypothetical protein